MERNGTAVAAMVVGIVSLLLGWLVVPGLVGGLAAIFLGVSGMSKAKRMVGRSGMGMARTGLITGLVGVVMGVVGLVLFMTAIGAESEGVTSGAEAPAASSDLPQLGPPDGYCDPNGTTIDPDC